MKIVQKLKNTSINLIISTIFVIPSQIYPNNLKSWELDKEAPQNFYPEQVTIADRQGTSEEPMPPKANSSMCLGINACSPCFTPSCRPIQPPCYSMNGWAGIGTVLLGVAAGAGTGYAAGYTKKGGCSSDCCQKNITPTPPLNQVSVAHHVHPLSVAIYHLPFMKLL